GRSAAAAGLERPRRLAPRRGPAPPLPVGVPAGLHAAGPPAGGPLGPAGRRRGLVARTAPLLGGRVGPAVPPAVVGLGLFARHGLPATPRANGEVDGRGMGGSTFRLGPLAAGTGRTAARPADLSPDAAGSAQPGNPGLPPGFDAGLDRPT